MRGNRSRESHVIRTIWREGSEMILYRYTPKKNSWTISWGDRHDPWVLLPCVACPSSSVGPSRWRHLTYIPEVPVQWIPLYSKKMFSEKRDQCIMHKMSQQRRQYPHPKTPNKLLDPSILWQSIPSSLETIEAHNHLKTRGSVDR